MLFDADRIRKTSHHHPDDGATSSGSSSSSPSSNGFSDAESVTASTSPEEDYKGPPSLPRKYCNDCRSHLGENETCACVPDVSVIPPSPLPTPLRALSPILSASDGDSNSGQIPDQNGIQVEITEVKPEHDGDSGSDGAPYPRDLWCQWGDPETVSWSAHSSGVEDVPVTNEVRTRTSPTLVFTGSEPQGLSGTTTSPPAETEETPMLLLSSDHRMSLTLHNFLGAGSHGTVVSANWAEGGRQVAVKVSHKLYISELDCTEPGLRNLKNELDVLKALKHFRECGELGSNFFPELFKSWQDEKNVYFAMDLYPWNLEDLRWANPTIGDKILWTAEMVFFY